MKRITAIILGFCILTLNLPAFNVLYAEEAPQEGADASMQSQTPVVEVSAPSAVLMEASTGEVIFEKDKVTYFDGNYEEYMRIKAENSNEDEADEIFKGIKERQSTGIEFAKISYNKKAEVTKDISECNKKIDVTVSMSNNKQENGGKTNKISNLSEAQNSYFLGKEINKTKNKISKLEREIEQKENEVKRIEEEMLKEENSTDYIKLKELQEIIQNLNSEIDSKMEEWDKLNSELLELENKV